LLREVVNDQTFLIGLSTTGFVDTDLRRILLSSALPGQHVASLDALFDVAGDKPLVVENDMHALAARWLQEHHQRSDEDVLLVYLDDGELGAALLVRGEPNWGCLVGGNELGHTRLPVKTAPCYCGHTGCMERICSTDFVHRHGAGPGRLPDHVAAFDGTQPAMIRMIELLATGLANSVNFIRPHRVVLASQYTRHGPFMEALILAIRSRIMTTLADRVAFHFWYMAAPGPGEAAGWLALAAIYYPNWTKAILLRPQETPAG
jgi:predicted NBD/HSP70 family sugar kinase